jgi:hypothetical protein
VLRADALQKDELNAMTEHKPCSGKSSEWYAPREIFDALGLVVDLDPCSPAPGRHVPAIFTEADDGLRQRWGGLVFMNPPVGGRNGHVPWLRKFLEQANGITIVRAYTFRLVSSVGDQGRANALPEGQDEVRAPPDGSTGRALGHGIVLLGMGAPAPDARINSGLGWWAMPTAHKQTSR